jgi:hypothetical protein
MTRDSPRLVDEQDGEAEIFSALWAAAPSFPQLPPDAPPELRALTVEVDDPKKVYSIYHASRRHSFQVLVERFLNPYVCWLSRSTNVRRYINQLRYGCQDPRCNTPTCFTCRRRLAGSTPLRRYNASSARTLACHLASQDNPEKGLCQYTGTPQSKAPAPARLRVSTKSSISLDGTKSVQWSARSPKASTQSFSNDIGLGKSSPAGFEGTLSSARHAIPRIITDEERADLEHVGSVVRGLEQPVEKDHRSFIQNLVGTVAFRMLEWLNPKNLESMIVSYTHIQDASPAKQEKKVDESSMLRASTAIHVGDLPNTEASTGSEGPSETPQTSSQRISEPEFVPDSNAHHPCNLDGHADEFDVHIDKKTTKQTSDPSNDTRHFLHDIVDSTSPPPSTKHINGPLLQDVHDRSSLELGVSKSGRVNGQIIQPEDSEHQKILDSQGTLPAKKARKRISSLTNSRQSMGYQESIPHHGAPQSPVIQSTRRPSVSKALPLSNSCDVKQAACEKRPECQAPRRKEQLSTLRPIPATDSRTSPQSLSVLSLELIEFISELLHEDGMRDPSAVFTTIPSTKSCLRKARKTGTQSKNKKIGQILIHPSPRTAPMWKSFIEQSLFYVLSSPKALLETFSEGGRSLLDTQTLWYCMMRLIHANSSLVFDSLWIVAADLYPPRELWPIYEWGKKTPVYETGGIVACTPDEAARLMSIGLHALIAAVPYTRDSAQLFALSRIRSYGVSSVQRRGVPPESVDLYLRTDDVFSDELILRLARRLFAAIPARRQYQELLGPNETGNIGRPSLPDILELVLAPLNFLDIEVPPILAFTPEDREIHEKRAPTLMIDWARTIMLLDWTGRAEVSADGAFGGALAMMSAICESQAVHPISFSNTNDL